MLQQEGINMSKIILYGHGGSGNHGCEAIVRSTISLLQSDNVSVLSSSPLEDEEYNLTSICRVIPEKNSSIKHCSLSFIKAYYSLKTKGNWKAIERLQYEPAFNTIRHGDLALAIGGDNYCYGDSYKYSLLHSLAKEHGAKTILWGCSVEPSRLTDSELKKDLAHYNGIVARESITYKALTQFTDNIVCTPDPAFFMPTESCILDDRFEHQKLIGINASPMILNNESIAGIAYENYRRLISFILEETNRSIALIPHVVWPSNDDRSVLKQLYDDFNQSERLILIDDHKAPELKYIISRCEFLVAARTHASIAAYSTGVPTLVVGSSVKARGIARDLFSDETGYILPVQELSDANDLTKAFLSLYEKRSEIIAHYKATLPTYLAKSHQALDLLKRIMSSK